MSENQFATHLQSKKHREAENQWRINQAKGLSLNVSAPTPSTESSAMTNNVPWKIQLATAESESQVQEILQSKARASVRLKPTDCLFCPLSSDTMEHNLHHMASSHSFFIPDLEYLVDVEGLLNYLGEKVSVDNICLYCSGRGKTLYSLEAVRAHMVQTI